MKHNLSAHNKRLFVALSGLVIIVAASVAFFSWPAATQRTPFSDFTSLVDESITSLRERLLVSLAPPAPAEPPVTVYQSVVQAGDTASTMLEDYLGYSEIIQMSEACEATFALTRLQAGKPYSILTLKDAFVGFEYEINREEKLIVERDGSGFDVRCEPIEFDVVLERVQGVITYSLFGSLTSIGEGADLAINLADLFGWEIDFFRDIQEGDSFNVLVEKRYRDDLFYGYGRILAAEFNNNGAEFQGFRLEDEQGLVGYFDAEGRNLKKAFLAAPLSFSRISSGFSMNRMHPILKVSRAHPAIDYAAPSGTPVKAIGDGTIVRMYWDNGGGNVVHLRHCNGYETKYLHLKAFADGLEPGTRVSQGQIIGYVGTTGLSTGPHLDFRITKNGDYINFANIENPRAEAVPEELAQYFSDLVCDYESFLEQQEVVISQSPVDDNL